MSDRNASLPEPQDTDIRQALIEEHIFSRAVPILGESAAGGRFVHGTGSLFQLRDRLFLISADHVLQDLVRPGETLYGIPANRAHGECVAPGGDAVLTAYKDEAPDVGILEIRDESVVETLLSSGWGICGTSDIGPALRDYICLYLAGWPDALRSGSGRYVVGKPIGIVVTQYLGETDSLETPPHELVDLLLEFPDERSPDAPGLQAVPRLPGMSGAGVWAVWGDPGDDEVWSAGTQVQQVAVQSGALHGGYLRAKRWHLLHRLFRRLDEGIAEDVRARLDTPPP